MSLSTLMRSFVVLSAGSVSIALFIASNPFVIPVAIVFPVIRPAPVPYVSVHDCASPFPSFRAIMYGAKSFSMSNESSADWSFLTFTLPELSSIARMLSELSMLISLVVRISCPSPSEQPAKRPAAAKNAAPISIPLRIPIKPPVRC